MTNQTCLFVNCLSTVCQQFLNCLSIVCQLFVNCLSTVCQLFVNFLSTVCQLCQVFANCLSTICQLLIICLFATVCQLFLNIVSKCQVFVKCLSSVCQLFIWLVGNLPPMATSQTMSLWPYGNKGHFREIVADQWPDDSALYTRTIPLLIVTFSGESHNIGASAPPLNVLRIYGLLVRGCHQTYTLLSCYIFRYCCFQE